MILDSFVNLDNYAGLHPLFAEAIGFLKHTNLHNLTTGRHEIDGDNLFALISEEAGVKKEEAKLEVHQTYLDIQFIISGTDHMGWRALAECQQIVLPYNPEKDYAFYADAPVTWFDVPEGHFTIFYPSDAHAPLATTELIKKVVLKVKI